MEILMKLENKRTGEVILLARYYQWLGWGIAWRDPDGVLTERLDPNDLDDWQLRFDKVDES